MRVVEQIIKTNGKECRDLVPDPSKPWYALCRLGTPDGKLQIHSQSQWTGFGDARPFREHRIACPVRPQRWREIMRELRELPITVRDTRTMIAWMVLGGEALVEQSFALKYHGELLAPGECGRVAGRGGWVRTRGLPKGALRHAPSATLRATVLLRDNRRCRMCGRTPEEDPHAFLEAHHGVPWGGYQSGLTVEDNLFTLCSTCHRGITDGQERQFLRSIGIDEFAVVQGWQERYFEGVEQYRRLMSETMQRRAS